MIRAGVAILLATLAAGTAAASESSLVVEAETLVRAHHLRAAALASLPLTSRAAFLTALRAVDPHAEWQSPSSGADPDERRRLGIGALILEGADGPYLVPAMEGPLYRQLIQQPAAVLSVNRSDVRSLSSGEVAHALASTLRSVVDLEVKDLTTGAVRRGAVRPEWHRRPVVEVMTEAGITMIRILGFERGTTRTELETALRRAGTSGRQPIAIDLRYATGGSLEEALDSAGPFLPEGFPVAKVTDGRGESLYLRAVRSPITVTRPVIVLTGPETASAAEVVVAALKFHGAAEIAGAESFGKCVAQSEFPLSDRSVLAFTTHTIAYADGSSCAGKGIRPDIVVARPQVHDTGAVLRAALGSTGGEVAAVADTHHPLAPPIPLRPPRSAAALPPRQTRPKATDTVPTSAASYRACLSDLLDQTIAEQVSEEIKAAMNLADEPVILFLDDSASGSRLCVGGADRKTVVADRARALEYLLDRPFVAFPVLPAAR